MVITEVTVQNINTVLLQIQRELAELRKDVKELKEKTRTVTNG